MDMIAIDRQLASELASTLEATRLELERLRKAHRPDDAPMSLKDAHKYLGVALTTLKAYIDRGEITPSEYGSRMWVMRSELDNFLARHRRGQ